jgi:hypothetical protein
MTRVLILLGYLHPGKGESEAIIAGTWLAWVVYGGQELPNPFSN